jgi:hypothetical protein
LYAKLSKEQFSEVIIASGASILWQSNLKNLDFAEFYSQMGISTAQKCNYALPALFGVQDFPGGLLITNHVTDNQYIYNYKRNILRKIVISDSTLPYIYINLWNDVRQLEIYKDIKSKNTVFNPKQSCIYNVNDSVTKVMYVTYRLEETIGADSTFNKMYTVVTLVNNTVDQVYKVSTEGLPSSYTINENNFFFNKDDLYISLILQNVTSKIVSDHKIIGVFRRKGDTYSFRKILDYHFPQYLIDYNIRYNFFNFISSGQYVTYPLSNSILNLESGKLIELPFEKSFYTKYEHIMSDMKITSKIYDMKYIEDQKYFVLLYKIDQILYASKLRMDSDIFEETRSLFDGTISDNNLVSFCLTDDGKQLVFSAKKDKCLSFKQIY